MEFLLIAIVIAALYLLGLFGYRLLLSLRGLNGQVEITKLALGEFSAGDSEVIPATPSGRSDLGKLLSERRLRRVRKERAARERQRRLINRISSIQIDKRFE
jgi:hypothetical protein